MAWDDEPPSATELPGKAGAWDAQPPTKEELGPQWSDLPGNILPNAEKVAGSAFDTGMRVNKGLLDLPDDTADTIKGEYEHLLAGENPFKGLTESPLAQDAKTVGGGLLDTAKAIPGQIMDLGSKDAWVNRPVENALTAASIAGVGKEMIGKGAPLEVPKAAEVPKVPVTPKELPVMEPGAKTGDPHALFSFNDNFGPEGKPRSMYTIYGDPAHPVFGKKSAAGMGGYGSTMTKGDLADLGIPVVGREARSVGKWDPLDLGESPKGPGEAPPPPPQSETASAPGEAPKVDPLQDVKDYINSKYGAAAGKPSWPTRVASILGKEANNLGAKDLGLQIGQIKGMGSGYEGIEKAQALVDYARNKGYFDPSLSDAARNEQIKATLDSTGKQVGAIRNIADQRGAPPLQAMRDELKAKLSKAYGIDAPKEIKTVLAKFDAAAKESPTFSGMSDLATRLNQAATPIKNMSQHVGPTTDAANIISRINNDAIRGVLNPQEGELYSQTLRDFGAHKRLEQATSAAERKKMSGRGAPGSITNRFFQEIMDKGGYRLGGNLASKLSKSILSDPSKVKTLPQFFEELAHQADSTLDDAISGMSQGGVVPKDVRDYVNSRSC